MGNSLAAVSPMASFVYALFLSALVAVSALPVDPNENPDGLSKHIADTLKGYSSQLGELQQNTEKLKTETDNKVKDAEMKVQQQQQQQQQQHQQQQHQQQQQQRQQQQQQQQQQQRQADIFVQTGSWTDPMQHKSAKLCKHI